MDYGIFLLLLIAIIEGYLTYYIFRRYQRTKAILFFGLFTAFVALWVLANGLPNLFPVESWPADFLQRVSFLFAAFIFPFLYFYILLHPYPIQEVNFRFIFFVCLAPLITSLGVLFDKNIVIGFVDSYARPTIYGETFWIYAVQILLFALIIPIEIYRKMKRMDGYYRYQFKMLLIAYLICGALGLSMNLILPFFFEIKINYWLGPASSIIWVGMVWWVINRK